MKKLFTLMLLFAVGSAQAFTVTVDDALRTSRADVDFPFLITDSDSTTATGSWATTASAIAGPGNGATAIVSDSTIGASGSYSVYELKLAGSVEAIDESGFTILAFAQIRLFARLTFDQDVAYTVTCTSGGFSSDASGSFDCGESGIISAGSYYFSANEGVGAPTVNNENYAFSSVDRTLAFSQVIPIPAAVWLFGSGLGLLGWMRRRQTA